MKRITVTKLTCTLFLLLLLVGCTEAEVMGGNHSGQQTGEVETTFNLEVTPSQSPVTRSITFTAQGSTTVDTLAVGETSPPGDTLQTRSATDLPDAQEKKVAGLWIGQYDADGTTLLSHQYIESVTGTKVTAKLFAANNCKVRFVANAGDLGSIKIEEQLNAKTLSYASTDDGRPASNLFAMTGTWKGNITGTTHPQTIPTVTLTRLAVKITFTYKINGTGFSFEPTSVSLVNAPDYSLIGELTKQLSSGITYKNYTGTINNKGATMYWYLPENMAGTGTPAVNSEKEKTGQGVTNPTYIELFGDAVQNGVEYKNVAFRFYPGKDANDYNIKRNDHFIMSIDLKGLDISDKRITVGAIPPITVSPAGNLPAAAGGTQEVQITSRAGVVWSLPLPQWLSATVDGQITPGGSTLTNQGPCKVTFTTTEVNPNNMERNQQFTVNLDENVLSGSFTLTQDPSMFTISSPTLNLGYEEGATGSVTVNGTPGLAWTVTPPVETNGIRPLTTNNTANGTNQDIAFVARENIGPPRTGTFNITVPDGDHTKTVTVKQTANPILTINQEMLDKYVAALAKKNISISDYPPFDIDGDKEWIPQKHGVTIDLTGVPTMSGSYQLQVESTQPPWSIYQFDSSWPAQDYCRNLRENNSNNWRLPTEIELYIMWDKAKGINNDASDDEEDSGIYGTKFIDYWYWSSSFDRSGTDGRCNLNFSDGSFSSNFTNLSFYVRCVRDLK